jgi:hypothetical protein
MKKRVTGLSIVLSIILSTLAIGMVLFQYAQTCDPIVAQAESQNAVVYISTAQDLFKLTSWNYSQTIFRLTNDIDLATDKSWHEEVSDWETHGWNPLDTNLMSSRVFDGGGYTISNLQIDRADINSGMFSQNSLHVKNLFFDFADIKNGMRSAVLAGINYGTVENVHASGSISANFISGGLIADNRGHIDNCSFDGEVNGRTAGGLIGENINSVISNSFSQGMVRGHLAGGLIGVSIGVEDFKIKTSFSVADVISESYDSTPTSSASFIAVKDETVEIENCYSLYGTVAVASGGSDGITTLSPTEFLQVDNLVGFDFDNYWTYATGVLGQRTLAVSSNEQKMYTGTIVKIVGDRAYYLPHENATLKLDTEGKLNIGVKSAVINGMDRKADFINGNCEFGMVAAQINVAIEAWFLIKLELKSFEYGKTLESEKKYYAPNEKIVLLAPKMHNYKLTLSTPFWDQEVLFEDITTDSDASNGYYRFSTDLGVDNYTSTSLLYVDMHYNYEPERREYSKTYNILSIVIISITVVAIIEIGIYIFTKEIKKAKDAEKK